MDNLAGVLDSQGKYEEAEAMNRRTIAQSEKVLGPEHPDTLKSVYYFARLLAKVQRFDESLMFYERACTGYRAVLGSDHPTTSKCYQHYSELRAVHKQHQHVPCPLKLTTAQEDTQGVNSCA